MMRRILLTLAVLIFGALHGFAQDATSIDYNAWESVAARAETAVENAEASDAALQSLRTEIVDWRTQFQAAQGANQSRIETIRTQIAALGPAPAEGETEAAEIAARRSELNDQLTRLEAPRRTAEEAFSRANGIVSEIDAILRNRQTEQFLSLGPSPLNPALWGNALFDLVDSVDSTVQGVISATRNPVRTETARGNLPLVFLLLSIAIVFVLRGRKWIERLAAAIEVRETSASAGMTGFLVSLGQVVIPVLGVIALARAILVTDLFGPRGEMILALLPTAGLYVFGARWLGSRVFPKFDEIFMPLHLPPDKRREGRAYAVTLGIVFAVAILGQALADFDQFPPSTRAVLQFPVVVIGGVILFRLGQILRREPREEGAEDFTFRQRFIRLLGRVAQGIGLLGPVLAAIGYTTAAESLVFPAISTLAVMGVVILLQEFIRDAYAFVTRSEGKNTDALIPVLLGFALALSTTPLLALIWGARWTDLTELWSRLRTGVTIGETTISPGSFFTLILVFTIGYLATRLVQSAMRATILPKTKIEPGAQTAIVSGLGYVGIFLAALIAISSAGLDLSSLAIVAGALSVGIGFGLQNIVSNFVSGIILLIERPISEGDMIDVGGQMGFVRRISVRSTRIETFDKTDVIVPNADLVSGVVTNWTRGNLTGRLILPVGVAYGTDTRKVEAILREIAEAHPMVLLNPPPAVFFMEFGADSLNFEIRAILRDVNWKLAVLNEMNHQIAERFVAEGIEIPFAQRDIWLRNPEALHPADPKPKPKSRKKPDEGLA